VININNIIVSGEAILSAETSGKPLGGRGSAPNRAGGAHSATPDPYSWWGGACFHYSITPPLISAFGLDFRSYGPHSAASPAVFIPQFLEF